MLHGKGHDRWFDKSFTLIVASNGRVSFKSYSTNVYIVKHILDWVVLDVNGM